MHVTFVYPPQYSKQPGLMPGQGANQNLALGYLSSFLKKFGHHTQIVNAFNLGITEAVAAPRESQQLYSLGLSHSAIADRIDPQTDCIGISIPFSNVFPIIKELIPVLRGRFPKTPILAGGIHASAFPRQCLDAGADYAVAGEGELAILAFAEGAKPAAIQGFHCRENGAGAGRSAFVDNLDEIPFPDRGPDDLALFTRFPPRGGPANPTITLLTSRGCPFACNFCSVFPVYGRHWRGRSAENVLEEIGYWYTKHGVRHFEFEDDNLTLKADRARAIFEGMIARFPGVTWAAHNGVRIDTLDSDLLSLIKRSGCLQLNLAIESGNAMVLDKMNKKLSLDKVEEVVGICGGLGLKTAGFLLVGYPGETAASFGETIRFFRRLRRLGLHAAIPLIVNAYPGTALFDSCKKSGFLAKGAEHHVFVEDDDFVSITTPDFTAAKVRAWKRRAECDINGRLKYFKAKVKKLLGKS